MFKGKYELGFTKLKVDQIIKADWNYKTDDAGLKEKLRKNIAKNGVIENLIVRHLADGKFECVNGNHRLEVLKEEKVAEVMVFNLGMISKPKAERIAIETNETKFESDQLKLSKVIQDILTEFQLDDIAGTTIFNESDIDALSKLTEFNFDQYNQTENESQEPEHQASLVIGALRKSSLNESVKADFKAQFERIRALATVQHKGVEVSDNTVLATVAEVLKGVPDVALQKIISTCISKN